jgi:hypothetical protein
VRLSTLVRSITSRRLLEQQLRSMLRLMFVLGGCELDVELDAITIKTTCDCLVSAAVMTQGRPPSL